MTGEISKHVVNPSQVSSCVSQIQKKSFPPPKIVAERNNFAFKCFCFLSWNPSSWQQAKENDDKLHNYSKILLAGRKTNHSNSKCGRKEYPSQQKTQKASSREGQPAYGSSPIRRTARLPLLPSLLFVLQLDIYLLFLFCFSFSFVFLFL